MTQTVVSIVGFIVILACISHVFLALAAAMSWKRHEGRLTTVADQLPSCTIIIPYYNNSSTINDAVASISNVNINSVTAKVIIVCDCESEEMRLNCILDPAMVKKLQVVHSPNNNPSKATALNYALNFIQTSTVLFLDADTCLTPHALQVMLTYYHKNSVDIVAGMILFRNPKTFLQRFLSWDKMISHSIFRFGRYVCDLAPNIPGQCFLARGDLFTQGVRIPENGADDLCFSYLMNARAASVAILPIIVAYEECRSSFSTLIRQRTRWFVYQFFSLPFIGEQLSHVGIWRRVGMLIHFHIYYVFPGMLGVLLASSVLYRNLLPFLFFGELVYCSAAVTAAKLLRQRIDGKYIWALATLLLIWPVIIILSLALSIVTIVRVRDGNVEPDIRRRLFQR